MNSLSMAVQNIFRNRRRSIVTAMSISTGCAALFLLSGFLLQLILSYQTVVVQSRGHLTIYRQGFHDFGSGDPAAYGIKDYGLIVKRVASDPVLRPLINTITPTQEVFGIASYEPANRSRVFVGTGLVPSDQDRMRAWDGFNLGMGRSAFAPDMRDNLPDNGFIGPGLANILGLCTALRLGSCPQLPETPKHFQPQQADQVLIRKLAEAEQQAAPTGDGALRIDLLAATANGAPNVVTLNVKAAQSQGFKALDDSAVIMNLSRAQQLVYGRGVRAASSIVVQLRHSSDVSAAKRRLAQILRDDHLEIYDFKDLDPLYKQITGLYLGIFVFVLSLTGMVAIFSTVNTVAMNVVERTREIGVLRALGMRRSFIRRQYLMEGMILGTLSSALGLLCGKIIAFVLNRLNILWTPPGASHAITFHVVTTFWWLQFFVPLVLFVLISGLASLGPAGKAARKNVVAALRHV